MRSEDTGIGIAKNQLDFIFESFSQAENYKHSPTEGTGLGLSIARQLVERQGGQLFIESELKKGTKLWFDLSFGTAPLIHKTQEQEKPQASIPDLKLLVVEDNYFNQMLIVEILKKNIKNPRIEIADNGKIALEKLEQQFFDIILMDVKMPVMNGYEATKNIRSSENINFNKIPILAVTANALPEQLQKCKEAGMNDFVTKPIDENDLLEKIYLLTNNQQQIDRVKLKTFLANDKKKVQQFLDIFKTQTPEQLKSLKKNVVKKDWEQISITAHAIKSQCQYLGLERIAGMAFEIEQLAEDKRQLELIPELAFQLEEKINAVIEKELT